ncbi:hypothetical protein FQ087_21130 [Sporosarcina sp. ANT_H38]|uniref:hypothetical protein n=1 Tax=Sporosarcina sp. ANT_H38 TaxID=2597358 RepID=UPI0011F3DA98|nr:hypothetical protein [Sporosarcina sp. ANT_H38]KAA0941658.1 hypothetical protein FQ087_21130 [Sporosarcina sp. ANT_H38]
MNSTKFKQGFCCGGNFQQLGPFKAVDAASIQPHGYNNSRESSPSAGAKSAIENHSLQYGWINEVYNTNFTINIHDNDGNFNGNLNEGQSGIGVDSNHDNNKNNNNNISKEYTPAVVDVI